MEHHSVLIKGYVLFVIFSTLKKFFRKLHPFTLNYIWFALFDCKNEVKVNTIEYILCI